MRQRNFNNRGLIVKSKMADVLAVPQNAPERNLIQNFKISLTLIDEKRKTLIKSLYDCISLSTSDCPGTGSEQAGKSSACQGCPNQTICASSKPLGPDPGDLFICSFELTVKVL